MEWPADGTPLDAEDLIRATRKAITFAYRIRRHRSDQDIPWIGPEIADDEAANAPRIAEQFLAKNLAYCLEDQGRDALDEILGAMLRVAIEQGRRIFKTGPEYRTLEARLVLAELLASRSRSTPDPATDQRRDCE